MGRLRVVVDFTSKQQDGKASPETPLKPYLIYRILNTVTGQCYIGLTKRLKRRKYNHFIELQQGTHHSPKLQQAYDEYGKRAFTLEILRQGVSESEICNLEKEYIKKYGAFTEGYNMTPGGEITIADGIETHWNGVTYPSIAAAAEANGVTIGTMKERVDKGYVADSDLLTHLNVKKPVIWNGVEYESIGTCAKAVGVSRATVRRRLACCYTCDADMPNTTKPKPVVWNGIEYPSIEACAEALSINASTMAERLQKGYSCDDDVANQFREVTWNGITYKSHVEAARALGINDSSLRRRLAKGYTCDADMANPHPNSKACVWNGIRYESISAAARANGVHPVTMLERLQKGYCCDDDMLGGRK